MNKRFLKSVAILGLTSTALGMAQPVGAIVNGNYRLEKNIENDIKSIQDGTDFSNLHQKHLVKIAYQQLSKLLDEMGGYSTSLVYTDSVYKNALDELTSSAVTYGGYLTRLRLQVEQEGTSNVYYNHFKEESEKIDQELKVLASKKDLESKTSRQKRVKELKQQKSSLSSLEGYGSTAVLGTIGGSNISNLSGLSGEKSLPYPQLIGGSNITPLVGSEGGYLNIELRTHASEAPVTSESTQNAQLSDESEKSDNVTITYKVFEPQETSQVSEEPKVIEEPSVQKSQEILDTSQVSEETKNKDSLDEYTKSQINFWIGDFSSTLNQLTPEQLADEKLEGLISRGQKLRKN